MRRVGLFRSINDYKSGLIATVAGTRFVVGCDEESVIESLSGYLFPSGSTPRNDTWSISAEIVDTTQYARLKNCIAGSVPVAVKPGFSYLQGEQDGVIRYEAAIGFDESPHLIFQDGYRLSIVGMRMDDIFQRLPLRIIREVALRQCEGEKGLFVHAACVRVRGVGILVVGNSGAGKTTTLMNLMSAPDAEFVTNDRGICRIAGDELSLETWPTAVRIGAGTAGASGTLLGALPELRRRENISIRAAAAAGDQSAAVHQLTAWASRKKYEFTPLELCSALRREARMGSTIDLVVFPRLELSGASIGSVAPTEHDWQVLRECLTTPVDAEWGRGWLGIRAVTDAALSEAKHSLVQELMRKPAIRITGDPSVTVASSILGTLEQELKANSCRAR